MQGTQYATKRSILCRGAFCGPTAHVHVCESGNTHLYARAQIDLGIALPGLVVIKLEFMLRLKIRRIDWLLADTCPQAANHCTLF